MLDKKRQDRWGYYYDMTGHEAPGCCFWCGKKTKYRYCCEEHGTLYRNNYMWTFASMSCIERYKVKTEYSLQYRCHDCGKQDTWGFGENFDVHHIIPLDGDYRHINRLNHQQNLVLLCKDCHRQRSREWNYLIKKYNEIEKTDNNERDRQLELL